VNHYWPFILSCTSRRPGTAGDCGPGLRRGERKHVGAAGEAPATGDAPTPFATAEGSGPRAPETRAGRTRAVPAGKN